MPAPYACGRTGGGGVQAPRIHGYIGLESIWSLVYQLRPFPRFFLFFCHHFLFSSNYMYSLCHSTLSYS